MMPLIFGGKIYNTLKAMMRSRSSSCWASCCSWRSSTRAGRPGSRSSAASSSSAPCRSGATTVDNIFVSLAQGDGLPTIDLSMISLLAAFAAIAGNGGLTNTPISNYTRDQGWGMGHHVGAIPSIVGGRDLQLSHVGMVFEVNARVAAALAALVSAPAARPVVVWMPACFLGVALPSMLSVQFLPRGTRVTEWTAAGMTADGVRDHVATAWGSGWGQACWYMTLLCGFLVLGPTMATTADGFVRRWVDVFWTASPRLRTWDPRDIKRLYFGVLLFYATFGLVMLSINKPLQLVKIATNIMNYALGFSCLHTLVVNMILLPKPIRPGWFARIGLALSGIFFLVLATITTLEALGWFPRAGSLARITFAWTTRRGTIPFLHTFSPREKVPRRGG